MTHELDYYWSMGEDHDNGAASCLIYKVQQHIRDVDRFSYEPCMISIGPYHHGAVSLQVMEKEKWGYLDNVLKLNCERNLLDYLTAIGELAKQARKCYSEDLKMNSETFLQMLLLDGCFILVALGGVREIMLDGTQPSGTENVKNEEIMTEKNVQRQEGVQVDGTNGTKDEHYDMGYWFIRFINHDLFLLENQIPFFIVRKIFELVAGNRASTLYFTDELAKYVESGLRWFPKAVMETDRPKEFDHLLHLCHIYFRPSKKPEEGNSYQFGTRDSHSFLCFGSKYFRMSYYQEENEQDSSCQYEIDVHQSEQQLNRWRRVAQYLEAGVKFKKREYDKLDPHSLLDIQFNNGTMRIPCIVVDDYTGTLFRNLIAFEQTCPQFGDDFTAYIVFLSQLVSMPEDVTLLAQREIIVHHLDSDESVSDLFTMLSKDVVFDFNGNYYLKFLCQAMEAHYQSRINRWMAWLWVNHFSNPWMAVGAFATVIVLVCTIVQTVYSILAYVNPPE
ncbi:unnamed protein product [Urochloa humidicola]